VRPEPVLRPPELGHVRRAAGERDGRPGALARHGLGGRSPCPPAQECDPARARRS
jgi:hypothetical protein